MAKLNCVFYWYKKLEHEVLNATRLLGYIYIYIVESEKIQNMNISFENTKYQLVEL